MNASALIRRAPLACGVLFTLTVAACGGGGSGTPPSSPPPDTTASVSKWPASGHYAVVLKAGGSTTAGQTTLALSLVHPSTPTVEYVMDAYPVSSKIGLVLYQGTYAAASGQFGNLAPVAYVDAPNGRIRTTLLAANGARPVQASGPALSLCTASIVAADYANPFATVIMATTPGADGVCGTADDGQAMVGFNADGSPTVQATAGYVGYLRSNSTGAPATWLGTDSSGAETAFPAPIGTGTALAVGIGTPGATMAYAPVENLSDTLLYTRAGALMALGNASGSLVRRTLSTSTGPDGWQPAGNDATYAYAYLNSNTAASGSGSWQLLAIKRADLSTTTIATGVGSVFAANAGPGKVYATVLNAATGSTIDEIGVPAGTQTMLWPSTTSVATASTNPSGLTTVLTASAGGFASAGVSVLDGQGATLYSASPSLMYGADNDAVDAASGSVVFSGLYLVAPSTSTDFGGSTLTRLDAGTKTTSVIGTLPTGNDLGGVATDRVFVTPISSDASFGGLFADRLSGTMLSTLGGAVYTFVPGQAGSLVRTTTQVQ